MDVLLPVIGALLVSVCLGDLVVTILHPSRRGIVSWRSQRLCWRAARGLSRRAGSEELMTYAAPAAMVAAFLTWILGLWLGFALIYAPFAEHGLSFASDASFGPRGFFEALYLSAVSLTTVGFGDVAGGTDVLRLVTVLEAASGLATVTGAITYVLAVYPLISEVREEAQRLADGGVDDARGAARLVIHAGADELRLLQGVLLSIHQQIRRFPVLFYFHAQRDEESLWHLLHAASLVTLQARWGLRHEDELARVGFYGAALERSLTRVMEDLEADFLRRTRDDAPLSDDEAAERLDRLRSAAEDAEAGSGSDETPDGFAPFLGHAEGFLALLASAQGYEHEALL
jgi:hypothetical protein